MHILNLPWYALLIYLAGGAALLAVFDRFEIIRPKQFRYFVVIFLYSLLFYVIYDIFSIGG